MTEKDIIKEYLKENLRFGYVVKNDIGFLTLEIGNEIIDKFPFD